MTQPEVNSEQVAALFAERQRYESWLATLESKRATTPQHIYHRVHADYTARLQRVIEQLSTHRAVLQELESGLVDRLTSLDIDEAKHRDEAAEAELRALVGELTEEHYREVRERTGAVVATIAGERAQLTEELTRLRAVLEAGGIAPSDGGRRVAPRREPEAPTAPAAAPAPPPLAQTPVAERRPSGGVQQPAKHDDWDLSLEQVPDAAASAPPAPRRPSGESRGERVPESGPFDDLEFLKSMVDSRTSGESVAVGSGVPAGGDEARAAGGSTGAPPVDSRSQSAASRASAEPSMVREPVEQVKTLKCQECGTLNYPTEWYCERCGAELAAL
ncbi:MAG TPA: zinc finger Ran-binding domain-containing protein [Gemmatimonadaceae bacterium]|nr:zinc finger Ran-binding domain-containing protein [Gemmatimonadaceae bacterium]